MKSQTKQTQIPTQQNIKSMHLKEIFLKALHSGGISRAQLKREMGLSFPSITVLVEELLDRGVLREEQSKESSGRGRPSTLLQINEAALTIPVVNMTRDEFQVYLFDCCGKLLSTRCLPHSRDNTENSRWSPDSKTLCHPLLALLSDTKKEHFITDLVMSVPGSINARGFFTSSALHISMPIDFMTYLEEQSGLKLQLVNNSDAEAYAEKFYQPLPEDFIFLHVGKGVGAGILRKGKIFENGPMRAGEIGHISIDLSGPPCSCGNRGCLERYIDIGQLCQEAALILPGCNHFDALTAAYRKQEPAICALLEEKARLLAIGISNMLVMQPVTHIVLGGGIEKLGPEFLKTVEKAIANHGFRKYMNRITITYTMADENAEAVGAVWNYIDHILPVEAMFNDKKGLNLRC